MGQQLFEIQPKKQCLCYVALSVNAIYMPGTLYGDRTCDNDKCGRVKL